MKQYKALAFDVGGTVFDWQTPIRAAVQARADAMGVTLDTRAFAFDWRTRMFVLLAKMRDGDIPWMNVDGIHRLALDEMNPSYPDLKFTSDDLDELNMVWHRLPVWPDFPDAIARLREKYTCVILTVLSWAIAVDCSRMSNVHWDGILSCELLGKYKPHPQVYQDAGRLLGIETGDVMMVAAHAADLSGAKAAGLGTAYVMPKLDEPDLPGFTPGPLSDFEVVAKDFTELADILCDG